MLLNKYSLPAERERGCVFAEKFENAAEVVRNGGTITGTPVINNGAIFNGTTDGIEYTLSGSEYNSEYISIVHEFTPYFNYDDNTQRYLFDCADSLGNNRFRVYIMDNANNNVMKVELNGTEIAAIATATYGDYWYQNERNILVIAGDAANDLTNVWLNGTQILTDDATAWTSAGLAVTRQDIGRSEDGSYDYYGKVHSFKLFNKLFTDQEALDYSNGGGFWNYVNEPVLNVIGDMAHHDPTNTRALDISGNGYHATWTAGSTAPTKNTTTLGYSFDGGDFMDLGDVLESVFCGEDQKFTISLWAKAAAGQTNNWFFSKYYTTTNSRQFFFRIYTGGALEFHWYRDGDTNHIKGVLGTTSVTDGRWHHCLVTYDGTLDANSGLDRVKFYVDSVSDSTSLVVDTGTLGGIYSGGDGHIGIAADLDSSGANPDHIYTGGLARIKAWDSVLTPMQIKDLYGSELRQINQL